MKIVSSLSSETSVNIRHTTQRSIADDINLCILGLSWSEFLDADTEVPGSIIDATRVSE
jgi:hypothetical protein